MIEEIKQDVEIPDYSMKVHKRIYNLKSMTNIPPVGFISDLHIDGNCLKSKLKQHLNIMKEENADIYIIGDIFDAMQGKNDPRSLKSMLKNNQIQGTYFNNIIKEAYEFLKPYKDNIKGIGYGNHEISVIKHYEIDLIQILAEKLGCQILGYDGFLMLSYRYGKNGHGNITRVYYTHGNGGNAPVTDGHIQMKRRLDTKDADVYISGHVHKGVFIFPVKYSVNNNGKLKIKETIHAQLGAFLSSFSNYSSMKGFAPVKPISVLLRHSTNGAIGWKRELELIT